MYMRSILKSSDNFSAIIFIFVLVLVFIHLAGVGKKKETMAQEILGRLRALSSVQQRRAAAILGAVVADAASKLAFFLMVIFLVANFCLPNLTLLCFAFYICAPTPHPPAHIPHCTRGSPHFCVICRSIC